MSEPVMAPVGPEPPVMFDGGFEGERATTVTPIVGNEVIFRVEEHGKPSAEPVFHARRPHRKSRTGCANCKKRRVKCDEARPNCRKCQIYGISCDYSTTLVQSGRSIESSMFSMSLSDIGSRIDQVLKPEGSSDEWCGTHYTYVQPHSLRYLRHFVATIASEERSTAQSVVEVLQEDAVRLAFTNPHVMHSLLGAAAIHLHHFKPDGKSHRVAESYHWHNAIRLYQKELASPIGPHNADSLMTTSMMLCAFVLTGFEHKPADSWLFSSDPTALNWLMIQPGLRYILARTAPYLEQSIWYKALLEAHMFESHAPGREGLHSGLADLCEITETTTEDDNPYHWPLRMLSPRLKLDPSRENTGQLNSFVVMLLPEFIDLLLRKDHKALLILGFWLGKRCLEKHQWHHSRFWAECTAICMYLENSDDSKMLKLLEFPAECCGYLLRHVKEEAVFEANFDLLGLF